MSNLAHNVRAYTFSFLRFYIITYTTLNKLLASAAVGAGGGYMFLDRPSVPLSVRL